MRAQPVWQGHAPDHAWRQSLDDFLDVPESELAKCLTALHRTIDSHKKLRDSARERGVSSHFTEFEWRPREKRKPLALNATATTPVQDLGLKPAAVHQFREMNLYALEDFAEVSANEVRRLPDVGDSTVAQIRELLGAIGLGFREPTNPHYRAEQRAKLARGMSPSERAKTVSDGADIAGLGLKTTTLTRCIDNDISTVGQLRSMTLRDLDVRFGQQSLIDLLESLDAVGLALQSRPRQREKWRYHAIRREALKRPEDHAEIEELEPWLGAATGNLAREGVKTVVELGQLAC